jgi:hypothetical protein
MEGAPANQKVRVPVSQVAAQMSTKKEVWDFLTQGYGAYCPDKNTVTIWHLKDMMSGTKGHVLAAEIKHLYVPHYEELTLQKILTWAEAHHPDIIRRFLPVEKEIMKLSRQVSAFGLGSSPRSWSSWLDYSQSSFLTDQCPVVRDQRPVHGLPTSVQGVGRRLSRRAQRRPRRGGPCRNGQPGLPGLSAQHRRQP